MFSRCLLPALVRLANDMLTQLHVSTRVRHLCDINAGVFLTLFEGLCGEKLPGQLYLYI